MKRSTMIRMIGEMIDEHSEQNRGFYYNRLATDILKALEEKGMLPPEHLFTSGERADHYLHEWESE